VKGHEYQFTLRDAGRAWLPILVVLAGIVAVLKLSSLLGLMPAPAAALDPNTTVLAHQARAAQSRNPAEIVLIGDSTCMIGVDAARLSRELPRHPPALNLGLVISFALEDYAELLTDFTAANPGQVRTVILLVTPEKLNHSRSPGDEEFWHRTRLIAQGSPASAVASEASADALGIRSLRENLLSHVLATPLGGKGAGTAYFGFSSEVDAYMTDHHGSLLDFSTFILPRHIPQRNWAFADDLETESRAFGAKIPSGMRLFVGLTPIAQSFCLPNDRTVRLDMLHRWNRWIQADVLLTNLPPSLPDVFFAGPAHLNEAGQRKFTSILAAQLAPQMEPH
jgi:hypothetical protein